jgi:hypothetical protein
MQCVSSKVLKRFTDLLNCRAKGQEKSRSLMKLFSASARCSPEGIQGGRLQLDIAARNLRGRLLAQ